MNSVELTGRLTRDPVIRYAGNGTAVGRFTLAADRQRSAKDGEQNADFISICCFGKTAELVGQYVRKGRLVGISGRIQTGYYEKEGKRVYTTDIIANRIEFLGRNPDEGASKPGPVQVSASPVKVNGTTANISEAKGSATNSSERLSPDQEANLLPDSAVTEEERCALEAAAAESPEAVIPAGFEKLTAEDIPF